MNKMRKLKSYELFSYLTLGLVMSVIFELFVQNMGIISMIFISTCVIHDVIIHTYNYDKNNKEENKNGNTNRLRLKDWN
jgi:hypothetical protein